MEEVYDKGVVSGFVVLEISKNLRSNIEIGDRRVRKLEQELRERGYFTIVPSVVNKGVDLQVFDRATGRLVYVMESTNYKKRTEYIDDKRLRRYIESLNIYDELPGVKKQLIVSFLENVINKHVKEETLQWLRDSKIEIVCRGRQE
jgi:hypothetical protein